MPAPPAPQEARPAPPIRQPTRLRRVVLAMGVILVAMAGLLAVAGVVFVDRYESAVGREDLLAADSRVQDVEHTAVTGPLNLLLIGSDLRANNPGAGQRSDTIIILHVTSQLDRAYLVSIPRDLLVTIPASPSVAFNGATAKINAAFQYGRGRAGGIQLLARTLTELTGLRFDGAAVVEFSGLKRAVDVVGGVNMCIDVRTLSVHTRKVFEPGCRLMNSTDVLDYLRQRQFNDGDFGRQRHQQQFLKAFLSQALTTGVIANPLKLDALLRAVGSALTVDPGAYRLTDLVYALRGIRPNNVTGIKVPTSPDMWGNQSVVVATRDATSLFAALRQDTLDEWARTHKRWVNQI
jgi:LCP family protein required for cell wall assembly